MKKKIKTRIKIKDNIADIKILIPHPMETGLREDKVTKKLIPIHFIKKAKIFFNNDLILDCDWSRSISKNPFINIKVKNVKSENILKIYWEDSLGEKDIYEKKYSFSLTFFMLILFFFYFNNLYAKKK